MSILWKTNQQALITALFVVILLILNQSVNPPNNILLISCQPATVSQSVGQSAVSQPISQSPSQSIDWLIGHSVSQLINNQYSTLTLLTCWSVGMTQPWEVRAFNTESGQMTFSPSMQPVFKAAIQQQYIKLNKFTLHHDGPSEIMINFRKLELTDNMTWLSLGKSSFSTCDADLPILWCNTTTNVANPYQPTAAIPKCASSQKICCPKLTTCILFAVYFL